MTLNPWKRIRQLEHDARCNEQWMEEMQRRVEDAQGEAFYKASEHFEARTKHLQASHQALLERLADISALTPPKQFFISAETADKMGFKK